MMDFGSHGFSPFGLVTYKDTKTPSLFTHFSLYHQELARTRMAVGNPPGKNGSLGDALNWEVLLQNIPNGEPLYFITDDKDYASPIDSNIFNAYLSKEWQDQKNSKVVYYKSLSEFFKEHFPKITLASELEKDLVIRDLANSSSFAETHTIISKLNKYSDFTIAQINIRISLLPN
jgi:hypothetical protein